MMFQDAALKSRKKIKFLAQMSLKLPPPPPPSTGPHNKLGHLEQAKDLLNSKSSLAMPNCAAFNDR